MSTDAAERMMRLFPTYGRSYAFFDPGKTTVDSTTGKVSTPDARTIEKPVTRKLWERHLAGKIVLGVVPVLDDAGTLTLWGGADVDIYGDSVAALPEKIARLDPPISPPYRTKSGGLRIILRSTEPISIPRMKAAVAGLVRRLGLDSKKVEVFPKQDHLDESKHGTVLWMPYSGENYPAIRVTGAALTVEEFARALEAHTMTPDQLAELAATPSRQESAPTKSADGAAYAARQLEREVAKVVEASQRNDSLNKAAFRLGKMIAREWISRDAVEAALWGACEANGLADTEAEKSRITIRDAIGAGLRQPHSDLPPPAEPLPTHDHGDAALGASAWLIRNRLPEVGVAVLSGQWGTFKTFGALDIAAAVMTGQAFTGEPVYRRGGVLFVAAEGAGDIPLRLAAVAEYKIAPSIARQAEMPLEDDRAGAPPIDPRHLPFRWTASCPPLLDEKANAVARLIATAAAADDHFRTKHDVPLVLVVIDTMAATAGWRDENDNAEAARAMNALRSLSDAADALVLVVDHFGKDERTGTRGASAKEAAADAVLAMLGEKQPSGIVTNLRLAIRKMRGGPSGEEITFEAHVVEMGQDDHGYPVTSRIIKWGVARASTTRPERKPKTQHAFDDAFEQAMAKHGQVIRPNGVEIRGVAREHVLDAFGAVYGKDRERSAVTQAFRSALGRATNEGIVSIANIAGVEFLFSDAERRAEEVGL